MKLEHLRHTDGKYRWLVHIRYKENHLVKETRGIMPTEGLPTEFDITEAETEFKTNNPFTQDCIILSYCPINPNLA